MGGDGNADLIGHPESAAGLEALLGHEDKDVPPQLLLIGLRQPAIQGHILLEKYQPCVREGPARSLLSASIFESKHAGFLAHSSKTMYL